MTVGFLAVEIEEDVGLVADVESFRGCFLDGEQHVAEVSAVEVIAEIHSAHHLKGVSFS